MGSSIEDFGYGESHCCQDKNKICIEFEPSSGLPREFDVLSFSRPMVTILVEYRWAPN